MTESLTFGLMKVSKHALISISSLSVSVSQSACFSPQMNVYRVQLESTPDRLCIMYICKQNEPGETLFVGTASPTLQEWKQYVSW